MAHKKIKNGAVKIFRSAAAYIRAEVREIMSRRNRQATRKEVGHEPARRECFEHWKRMGGRERFRSAHRVTA